MKKNILLSLCMVMAVTAVMTSCKKDHDFISIRATISDYRDTGKDGKTYIETINDGDNDVNWVSWNTNDKVWINNTAYNVTVYNEGTSNRYAKFDRVTYVDPDDPNRDGYYAVYPASQVVPSSTNNNNGFPKILLPQVQIYRTDGNDKNHGNQIIDAPMAAYCQASSTHVGLNFTNLCSLLRIDLSELNLDQNTEVAYITVSSSTTPLWGKADISSGTDGPTLSSPSLPNDFATSDNTVTLDFTDNGINGSDGDNSSMSTGSAPAHGVTSRGPFYVVLPPATEVAALSINIYVFTETNNNRNTVKLYTRTDAVNHTINISAGNIYNPGSLSNYVVNNNVTPSYPNLGKGIFSVSNTKKVRFSLGNLQYQGSTKTWRFAEHQYEALGGTASNTNPSQTQSDWMDLFNWGTSGYNNIVPWSKTNYATEKITDNNYPLQRGNFSGSQYDWGKNPIINGGNQPNKWRTLTGSEWHYLIFSRDRAANLWKKGKYNDINGVFIFPDSQTLNINNYNIPSLDNVSDATWNTLMNLGCIFLPHTGYRKKTSTGVSYQSGGGYYWASSNFSYGSFFNIHHGNCFYCGNSLNFYECNFNDGLAVRLVRDVD